VEDINANSIYSTHSSQPFPFFIASAGIGRGSHQDRRPLCLITGPAAFLGSPERKPQKMVVDEINKAAASRGASLNW